MPSLNRRLLPQLTNGPNCSSLLRTFVGEGVLTVAGAEMGFGLLLTNDEYVADLTLDYPEAKKMLGQFVARAIQDQVPAALACFPARG
eukprot:SAG11_NODE_2552_length_3229_cov_1.244728_4_plen_88_part_00